MQVTSVCNAAKVEGQVSAFVVNTLGRRVHETDSCLHQIQELVVYSFPAK